MSASDRSERRRLEIIQRHQFATRLHNDSRLNRIVSIVAQHFKCPIAAVSIVEETFIRFLATFGLGGNIPGGDRNGSFCTHTVLPDSSHYLLIPDVSKDERFINNPIMLGNDRILFHAGIPVIIDGIKVGTVSISDFKTRYDFENRLSELISFTEQVIAIFNEEIHYCQNNDSHYRPSFINDKDTVISSTPQASSNSLRQQGDDAEEEDDSSNELPSRMSDLINHLIVDLSNPINNVHSMELQLKKLTEDLLLKKRKRSFSHNNHVDLQTQQEIHDLQSLIDSLTKEINQQKRLMKSNLQNGLQSIDEIKRSPKFQQHLANNDTHNDDSRHHRAMAVEYCPLPQWLNHIKDHIIIDNNHVNNHNNNHNNNNDQPQQPQQQQQQLKWELPDFSSLQNLEISLENQDLIITIIHFLLILCFYHWNSMKIKFSIVNVEQSIIQFQLISTNPFDNSSSDYNSDTDFHNLINICDNLLENSLKAMHGNFENIINKSKTQQIKTLTLTCSLRRICRNERIVIIEPIPRGNSNVTRTNSNNNSNGQTKTSDNNDDDGEVTFTEKFEPSQLKIVKPKGKKNTRQSNQQHEMMNSQGNRSNRSSGRHHNNSSSSSPHSFTSIVSGLFTQLFSFGSARASQVVPAN